MKVKGKELQEESLGAKRKQPIPQSIQQRETVVFKNLPVGAKFMSNHPRPNQVVLEKMDNANAKAVKTGFWYTMMSTEAVELA